jgi:hypothetical protein
MGVKVSEIGKTMKSLKEWWSSLRAPRNKADLPQFRIDKPQVAQDLEWLFDLVKLLVGNKKFNYDLQGKKVFTDEDLLEAATEITLNVLVTLSDRYMQVVKAYINEDQIQEFIGEIVVKQMIDFGLSKNRLLYGANGEKVEEEGSPEE